MNAWTEKEKSERSNINSMLDLVSDKAKRMDALDDYKITEIMENIDEIQSYLEQVKYSVFLLLKYKEIDEGIRI